MTRQRKRNDGGRTGYVGAVRVQIVEATIRYVLDADGLVTWDAK